MDVVSIIGTLIAVISAIISTISYQKQKNISKLNANLLLLEKTQSMLHTHPELLELHGVGKNDLESCNVSSTEFIYILNSLYSGLAYYTIDGSSDIKLSNYRKEFLKNEKVRLCWDNIIKDKMIYIGSYTKAIDNYYKLR